MQTLLKLVSATLILASWAQPSHALSPAIPANILCGADHLFTGKITSVESHDCKLSSVGVCSPRDAMMVRVLVDRVVKTTPSAAHVDPRFSPSHQNSLSMYIFAFGLGANRYPALLREADVPVPMTNDWLESTLVGQDMVFLAGARPSALPSGPPLLMGSTLPADSLPWVESTLRDCGSSMLGR